MQLFFDIDSNTQYDVSENLNEATGKTEKKYKIKGVFSTIGEKNRNGRVYPLTEWQREVNSYQSNFSSGSANLLMEWEHPARTAVDPMQAVAKIESLKIDGKYVIGEAVLLNNEKANQLKSLIDNGIKICVSSRGVGNVNNGIVSDFKLITYDIVPDPSDYNATMNGIVESCQLNEGIIQNKHFNIDNCGNIIEVKGQKKQTIEKKPAKKLFSKEEYVTALHEKFNQYLNFLSLNEDEVAEFKKKQLIINIEKVKENVLKSIENIKTPFINLQKNTGEIYQGFIFDIQENVLECFNDFFGLFNIKSSDIGNDVQEAMFKVESEFSKFAELDEETCDYLKCLITNFFNYKNSQILNDKFELGELTLESVTNDLKIFIDFYKNLTEKYK